MPCDVAIEKTPLRTSENLNFSKNFWNHVNLNDFKYGFMIFMFTIF